MKFYYDLENVNTLNFISYIGSDSNYSGFSMTKLRDNNKYTSDKISFLGYRVKAGAPFTVGQYNETVTLQTTQGMVVASTTYADPGSGLATEIKRVHYMIHNGTGIFKNKTWLTIDFNNTSVPAKRVITVN